MSRPDEGLIHQWLDGECTPEESARIEQLVATDPAWAAAVAEARGLIAASARIVGALDAVPRAVPTAQRGAAPSTAPPPRRAAARAPRWMGIAATLVLVAGTAYVLSEQRREPLGPVLPPAPSAEISTGVPTIGPQPSATPSGGTATTQPAVAVQQPTAPVAAAPVAVLPDAPPAAPTVTPEVAAAAPTAAAAEAEAAKRAESDMTAARDAALAAERQRSGAMTAARRSALTAEAPRGALPQAAPAAPTTDAMSAPTLAGCWRVSAPPEHVGLLESPPIRRAQGDTLVLLTLRGDVTVTRVGDELRGGLQARLVPCGASY